jgi:hypothetical protein
MTTENKTFIGFKCTPELSRCLSHIARREGRTVSGQIRWFLERALDGEEPPGEVPELIYPSVEDAQLIGTLPAEEEEEEEQ